MRERVKKSFWVALVSIFATLGVVTANAQTIGVAVSDCPTWILDHAAPEITDYYVPENKYAENFNHSAIPTSRGVASML